MPRGFGFGPAARVKRVLGAVYNAGVPQASSFSQSAWSRAALFTSQAASRPLKYLPTARRIPNVFKPRSFYASPRIWRQQPASADQDSKKHDDLPHREQQSSQNQQQQQQTAQQARRRPTFIRRLSGRLRDTPTNWSPIPFGLGVAFLSGFALLKSYTSSSNELGDKVHVDENHTIAVKGPWQVHVIGALPLRTLSRIYGALNEYTLPVWFRVPGYKLYGYIFGVNFDEVENDLQSYTSLSDFFMRRLKPGARVPDQAPFVSPADGKVVNFGIIENRRVEQVKGVTYSLDALLGGSGLAGDPTHARRAPETGEVLDEQEFADINGIEYSLDQLLGDASPNEMQKEQTTKAAETSTPPAGGQVRDGSRTPEEDASREETRSHTFEHADLAVDVGLGKAATDQHGPRPGNSLFFAVVYLAPGDYHRFHSPASWVVEKRRHFPGELFSVSPWMSQKLADLFVLNERVALLGRWRHGFFSMVPVGATNVGRIVINFDKDLETNSSTRTKTPGKYSEASYVGASQMLRGQPLRAFDEMGGFMLGSTIVMVFEAPSNFEFNIAKGDKVRVGQKLGELSESN